MAADALHLDGLRFRYPGAAWRLEVGDFRLAAGEQALLVGGSGRGKSTLLMAIAGLHAIEAGRIVVSGTDLAALRGAARDTARGRSIGMIFQTFNLLHGFSAMDNVLTALMFAALPAAQHEQRARELLGRLGIPDPDAPVDRLSVGQQQRVAVARALAGRPALVLADEPTASLDPENTAAAMDLIQAACREDGAALLCTSHDPSLRGRFTRIETVDAFVRMAEGAHA